MGGVTRSTSGPIIGYPVGYIDFLYPKRFIQKIYPIGMSMNTTAYTPKQLGQVLKGQRQSQQLTQKEAAGVVGLLPKTISRLELATETASINSLFRLLSALQLELVVRSKSQESPSTEW